MKNVTTIFATLLLMASSAALAQDQEPPAFDDVDTDGNGYVSSSELAAAGVDIDTEDADTNGDGMLDRDEYESAVDDA